MAHVASCPQCALEFLVPDGTEHDSWAKCPHCRAFFQLSGIATRELPSLLLVESDATDPTKASVTSDASMMADQHAGDELAEEPRPEEVLDVTDRIDKWFRSAHAPVDTNSIAANETVTDADQHAETMTDIELEDPISLGSTKAPWEDAQHMERLLADIEKPPAVVREIPKPPPPVGKLSRSAVAPAMSATSDASVPLIAKSKNNRPRRKRSLVRMLTMSVAAGVVGLAAGYYVLLWLRGPAGDFLDVAQHLPNSILPPALQSATPVMAPPPVAVDRSRMEANVTTSRVQEPPEIQASYTQERPAVSSSLIIDDRYGLMEANEVEEPPAQFDAPSASPIDQNAGRANKPLLVNAPTYSAEELTDALSTAEKAQPTLASGRLEDSREVQRAKGQSYLLLADLAEKVTFVSPSTDAAATLDSARRLFQRTFSDMRIRNDLAQIVPMWIESPHRKNSNRTGILFAASLVDRQDAGAVIEINARLESNEPLTLLVSPQLAEEASLSNGPIGVIGSIVEDPASRVGGYAGQAPRAVWVANFIPLE